jgi:hypothetical protein
VYKRLRSIDTPPGWKSPIRFLSSAVGREFGRIDSQGFEGPGPAVSPCEPVMSSQELIKQILLDAVRASGLVDVRFAVEKLSWAETAREMAAHPEDWRAWRSVPSARSGSARRSAH